MELLTPWRPQPDAVHLLADRGGPFDSQAFRSGFVAAFPDWRDVTVGGRLPDGTEAAIAALSNGRLADSMPFNSGGVVSTRALGKAELVSFLHFARRSAGVPRLDVRWCLARPGPQDHHIGAQVAGWTTVVHLRRGETVRDRLGPKAVRALRIADEAGADVRDGSSVDDFVRLYGRSAVRHWLRYPAPFLRGLAELDLVRTFDVRVAGRTVSSILVLMSATRWTTWLATQDSEGREIHSNYLATASVLQAACDAGVAAVDLGTSAGMPGVALFKSRFDSVDVPILQLGVGSVPHRLASSARRVRAELRWRTVGAVRRTVRR